MNRGRRRNFSDPALLQPLMNRRTFYRFGSFVVAALLSAASVGVHAQADGEGPDQLIKRLSTEVLDTIKSDKEVQAGDVRKVTSFVDGKIMPHVNFTRMTASAVGRNWRQATPEQQKRLQDEFKTLLVRTYAGARSEEHTSELQSQR